MMSAEMTRPAYQSTPALSGGSPGLGDSTLSAALAAFARQSASPAKPAPPTRQNAVNRKSTSFGGSPSPSLTKGRAQSQEKKKV